jgi:hypothetical protein
MGGVCVALYGFIAVSGLKMIQKVDLSNNANLFTVSVVLIAGVGGMIVEIGAVTITSVACALILGILTNLITKKSLKKAEKIKESCEKIGADIITFDDVRYPDSLRTISNPPYVLYMRGEIMKWDRILGIGVVGTRTCSDYGHKVVDYIVTAAKKEGMGPYEAEDVFFVVQGEMEYGDSLENE